MQAESAFSFIELVHRLGARAAEELFGRIDKDLRHGEMILGRNVRDARPVLGRLRKGGNVQVIISERSRPKRTRGGTSECLIVLRIDDLEAVVKATHHEFNWAHAFAPRSDLPAAASVPTIKRGSHGHRTLRVETDLAEVLGKGGFVWLLLPLQLVPY